jgi:hypothetical protein
MLLPAHHLSQMSSEFLRDPPNDAQCSDVALSGIHEGLSGVAPESLVVPKDPTGDASRATKLDKDGRPLSQTSHRESGSNSDTTRPQKRLVCLFIPV